VPSPIDGIVLVDKPAGITSHDVVAGVRRALGRGVKVGHAGTLDPFATGLMIVLVGRGTRAQRFFMALGKSYDVVARLGWTSTTGDVEGEIAPGRLPSDPLSLPIGSLRQRPPAYSAVKIGGRRAYALARAGVEVEIPERTVVVSRFDLVARKGETARFVIECGSGTYVRSLIADLGDAYCTALRRTAIGSFRVEDADPDVIVPLGQGLSFLPSVTLDAEHARVAGFGVAVPSPNQPGRTPSHSEPLLGPVGSVVRLLDPDGDLIALAEPRDTEQGPVLKPIVGLRG